MTSSRRRAGQFRWLAVRMDFPAGCLALMICLAVSGCKTAMKMPFTSSAADDATTRRLASTDDVHGPLERVLLAAGKGNSALPQASAKGLLRYQAAETLYKAGKYKQAEKAFIAVAKRYKNTQVQEDALFMTAESQFQRKRYAWAQDSYDQLLKEFPSTRYLDRVSRRKFEIARVWLQFPANIKTSDIQPVNFDNPPHTPPPKSAQHTTYDPSRRIPIFPNLWDRSRPVFDTSNRALESLKSIWIKDPTGPLADDALMMTAGHYVRTGNYAEAARVFNTLREQYPQSPYLEKAYIIGSQMTLVSHQGPAYDGKNLDEARKLKEATLRLFPNTADRDRLRNELRKINEAKAREQWVTALFWKKKRKPESVAIYCHRVINEYPNTQYAALARDLLAQIDPQPAVVASREPAQTPTKIETSVTPAVSPPIPPPAHKTPRRKTPRRFIPSLPRRIFSRRSRANGPLKKSRGWLGATKEKPQRASQADQPVFENPFGPESPSVNGSAPEGKSTPPFEEPPGRVHL